MFTEKTYCSLCCEDNVKFTSNMKDESIDSVVTSPPYDELRKYEGYVFNFDGLAKELYRVLKPGGVIVWVVGDAVKEKSETGTSFQQLLDFKNKHGFNIHDTMIYQKNSSSFPSRREGNRYSQVFEYMFILSKGTPKTHHLISDKPNLWEGWVSFGQPTMRGVDGKIIPLKKKEPTPKFSPRNNIWEYNTGKNYSSKDSEAFEHPASFPEGIVWDNLTTWTNPGDSVYDPFMGSGTVAKVSYLMNRKFVGCDVSKEYFEIAKRRMDRYKKLTQEFNYLGDTSYKKAIEGLGYSIEGIKEGRYSLSFESKKYSLLVKPTFSYEKKGYLGLRNEDMRNDLLLVVLSDFKSESGFMFKREEMEDMITRKFYAYDSNGALYFNHKVIENYGIRVFKINKKV